MVLGAGEDIFEVEAVDADGNAEVEAVGDAGGLVLAWRAGPITCRYYAS